MAWSVKSEEKSMKRKKPMAEVKRSFIFLGVFGIAMGFLETIVVVYLRQIYYPQGFDFPLSLLSPGMIGIEWLREIATIIMLMAIGVIAGKDNFQRFFYFLYTFAIWDIFYYVGLKLLLDWPTSFLTWDILFLIPVPWIGPVLAPIICSLTLILFAVTIIYFQGRGCPVKIKLYEWGLALLGALIILGTFIWDYGKTIIQNDFLSGFWTLSENKHFWQVISQYRPLYYNWYLFAIGEILILYVILQVRMRMKSELA
jgi:hypothetical protein